jgi:hypothetical protein
VKPSSVFFIRLGEIDQIDDLRIGRCIGRSIEWQYNKVPEIFYETGYEVDRLIPVVHEPVKEGDTPFPVAGRKISGEAVVDIVPGKPEHVEYVLLFDPAFRIGDHLVEDGLRVPYGPGCGPCNPEQGFRVRLHGEVLQDPLEEGDDKGHRHPLEHELLAAWPYGSRHLVYLGGSKNEYDVVRRLLEGLEKRIERFRGEHVHLVDDIDLVPGRRRGKAYILTDLADLVYSPVGRAVYLH